MFSIIFATKSNLISIALVGLLAFIGFASLIFLFLLASESITPLITQNKGITLLSSFSLGYFIFRIVILIRPLLTYLELVYSHQITFKVIGELRLNYYFRLSKVFPTILNYFPISSLLQRLQTDISHLDNLILGFFIPITSGIILVFTYTSLLWYTTNSTFAILFLAYVFVILIANFILRKSIIKNSIQSRNIHLDNIKKYLYNKLIHFKLFEVYRHNQINEKQIDLTFQQKLKDEKKYFKQNNLLASINQLIQFLFYLFLCSFVIDTYSQKNISLEALFFVVLSFPLIQIIINTLNYSLDYLFEGIESIKRINRIEQIPNNSPCSHLKNEPPFQQEKQAKDTLAIEFKNIYFQFHSQDQNLFKDFNFRLAKQEKIAIMGAIGSGKSTLFNLILKQYSAQEGKILLWGKNLNELTQDFIHKNVAILPQNVHIFSNSLYNNLTFVKDGISNKELEQVIKLVELDNLVNSLPDKLQTVVGLNSDFPLSAGEIKRIGLARAILTKAPILLLDEPTENLDINTAQRIMKRLKQILKDKTILMVTHKKDALELVDSHIDFIK